MLTFPQELHVPLFILGLIFVFIAGLVGQAIYRNVVYWLTRPPNKRPPRTQPPIMWLTVILFLVLGGFIQYLASLPSIPPIVGKDDSSFIYDELVQDDDPISPGQTFLKAWRLYNKGDTNWKNYEARRIAGIFGPSGFLVPDTLAKHDVVLSQPMTAPTLPGCYRTWYQLYNGSYFFGEKFDVQIAVVTLKTKVYALFIDDLNVRDGTLFSPGARFMKGWKLHNCGTNTWENYKAKRVSGDLAGPSFIPVPVTSGHQDMALWVWFTAPTILTKQSIAVYQLEDAQGNPIPNALFDVSIKTETSVT